MANTQNLDLVKPAGTDRALIATLNGNSDKIDTFAGAVEDSIAIVCNGNTHAAIAAGQFAYVKNHGSLTTGLYRNNTGSTIAADATLSSSNLTPDSSGGLNALKGDLDTLNSNIAKLCVKGSTHTLSSGGAISAQTISCPGLTANHRVCNWGLSTGDPNNPPGDIEITEGTNQYTLTVTNVTRAFSFTPVFILPQN